LPRDLVACGEVGLSGEIRQVSQTPRRLAEAARLGFRRALVPVSADVPNADLDVVRVSTLYDAVVWAGLIEPDTGRACRSSGRWATTETRRVGRRCLRSSMLVCSLGRAPP
jgi:hypothetical protein